MKRLLLLLIVGVFCLDSFGQKHYSDFTNATSADGSNLILMGTGVTKDVLNKITIDNLFKNRTMAGTLTIPTPFTLGPTSVTTTGVQLNYLNTTTSNVQTQLNGKLSVADTGLASDDLVLKHADTTHVTGNYTLLLTDDNRTIYVQSASYLKITIPADASVNFPNGTIVTFVKVGAGVAKVAGATGVNVYSPADSACMNTQYQTYQVMKRSTNFWVRIGDFKD